MASASDESARGLRLGAFRLDRRIGRGGMGEVWRGVHVAQDVPVALKIMTADRARNPKYLRAFSNEVRAVARLDHPGIVMVLDHGEINAQVALASRGRFAEGCPYLVMELSSGGSLAQLPTPQSWPTLRGVLLALLEALSHAHARGVIHRDLKPANVLLSTRADLRPGLKVSDFGIAQAVERQTSLLGGAGTPRYMAPEQIARRWRDQGPWTDLYALGCVAYELCTGATPFTNDEPREVLRAHLTRPVPPPTPRLAVADGFTTWLTQLLAKNPAARFRRAADAAWALIRLGDPSAPLWPTAWDRSARRLREDTETFARPGEAKSEAERTEGSATERDLFARASHAAPGALDAAGRAESPPPPEEDGSDATAPDAIDLAHLGGFEELRAAAPAVEGGARLAPGRLPPLPSTWRQASAQTPPLQLVGAGLGLFGLRTPPLVGREHERDALWAALRATHAGAAPRFVALRGPTGVGKSRLALWLARRAHEMGAATTLRVTHSPTGDPRAGLGRMLSQHLRCDGLSHEETVDRLAHLLGRGLPDGGRALDWRALGEIIAPAPFESVVDSARIVYFPNPEARYRVIERLLELLGRERLVVLWIDDAQWGSDALGLAAHLLGARARGARLPVLTVATVQDEGLAERPLESEALRRLAGHPHATTLQVAPLPHQDQRALVADLLRLDGPLAAQVADRTAGNPQFAVQLVGDWVERGVLEVGRGGFVLSPAQTARLPDDLHEVWSARVDRALKGDGEVTRAALEVAAALGQHVDPWEWHVACHESSHTLEALEAAPRGTALADVMSALQRKLLAFHLAHSEEAGGWSFVHGMLRESVGRGSRDAGRWAGHNLGCVAMLGKCYPLGGRGVAERLGRHLAAAGRGADAVGPLLQGAHERRERSEYGPAHELLWLRERVLLKIGAGEQDAAWGQGWALRAQLAADQHNGSEAERWARRAAAAAERFGWDHVLAESLQVLGTVAERRGDAETAERRLLRALRLYKRRGEPLGVAACLQALGQSAARRGRFRQARAALAKALSGFEREGRQFDAARCVRAQAQLAWRAGAPTRAGALFGQSLAMCEKLGDQLGAGLALGGLGDVARQAGRLEAARGLYERSIGTLRALDAGWEIHEVGAGFARMAEGDYEGAREVLERVASACGERAARAVGARAAVGIAACEAAAGGWARAEESLDRGQALAETLDLVDPDIAWAAETAARQADLAGNAGLATRAAALARRQWERVSARD